MSTAFTSHDGGPTTRPATPPATGPDPSTPPRVPPGVLAGGWAALLGGGLLLGAFAVAPVPDPANSLTARWVPAQALHCVAFMLLVLGVPVIAASLGRRLGVAGAIGYVALMTQLVLSMGSHVYLMWVVPILERHRQALGPEIAGEDSPLHKYYTTHSTPLGLVLGTAVLGLALSLWRCGRGLRTIAVLFVLTAVGEALQTGPLGLGLLAIACGWLGLRLIRHGSVLVPLRHRPS